MASFGAPFVFPFGGDPDSSSRWVGNVLPASGFANPGDSLFFSARCSTRDQSVVSSLSPARALIAFGGTYLDARKVNFDTLDEVFRSTITPGPIVQTAVAAFTQNTHMRIAKGSNNNEASVFVHNLGKTNEVGYALGFTLSSMGTSSNSGPLIGIDADGTSAVYVFFKKDQNTSAKSVELYKSNGILLSSVISVPYEWGVAGSSYYLYYDQVKGVAELFISDGFLFERLFRANVLGAHHGSGTVTLSKSGSAVALWGVQGGIDDFMAITDLYLPDKLYRPVDAGLTSSKFYTQVSGSDLVSLPPGDPVHASVGPWPLSDYLAVYQRNEGSEILPNVDWVTLLPGNTDNVFGLIREDSDLGYSIGSGFYADFEIECDASGLSRNTGFGFRLFDGISVMDVVLASISGSKYVGIQLSGGYLQLSPDPVDWSNKTRFTVEIDPTTNMLHVYVNGASSPAISVSTARDGFPTAADVGVDGASPHVVIGFLATGNASGPIKVYRLEYSPICSTWRATTFLESSPPDNQIFGIPLSGSTLTAHDDAVLIESPAGVVEDMYLPLICGGLRGNFVDFEMALSYQKKDAPPDLYCYLTNGNALCGFGLTANDKGKFCTAVLYDYAHGTYYTEVGDEHTDTSFRVDWDQLHSYRVRFVPFVGAQIYLDGILKLTVPLSKLPPPHTLNAVIDDSNHPRLHLQYATLNSSSYTRGKRALLLKSVRSGTGTGYEVSMSSPVRMDGSFLMAAAMDE